MCHKTHNIENKILAHKQEANYGLWWAIGSKICLEKYIKLDTYLTIQLPYNRRLMYLQDHKKILL